AAGGAGSGGAGGAPGGPAGKGRELVSAEFLRTFPPPGAVADGEGEGTGGGKASGRRVGAGGTAAERDLRRRQANHHTVQATYERLRAELGRIHIRGMQRADARM